jgi:hypothetical protein
MSPDDRHPKHEITLVSADAARPDCQYPKFKLDWASLAYDQRKEIQESRGAADAAAR